MNWHPTAPIAALIVLLMLVLIIMNIREYVRPCINCGCARDSSLSAILRIWPHTTPGATGGWG